MGASMGASMGARSIESARAGDGRARARATGAMSTALAPMGAHVALGICYFLTAQKTLDMGLVDPRAQPLTGMIYAADALSASMTRMLGSRGSSVRSASGGGLGVPSTAFLLPVFDLFGLTCAFEAMRALGGPLYQTLSGMLIPLSALLSGTFLKRTFSTRQMMAISLVICGLAVKAQDVRRAAAASGKPVDVRGILIANLATVSYGFRGLVMEYLSSSGSGMSGNAQTMLMGTCGLAAFLTYSAFTTARDADGMIWAYYDAKPRVLRDVLTIILGNMLARALMVKMMMLVVQRAGATQLALSNAIRSVGVIAFSHVFFCANDARQCLNRNGAISAIMVVVGGLAYALSTPPKTASKTASKRVARTKSTTKQPSKKSETARAPSVRRRSARLG